MHSRGYFRAIAVKELTRQEKIRAQEGLMILNQKGCGRVKGRLAYNGKATQDWITKQDKRSPTVLTESIKVSSEVDAHEGRDVLSMDVPNAFIQTILPPKADGERIIMKIRGKLVDWLIDIEPMAYLSLVVIENGSKVIYLDILQEIYGMLEASLLWYKKFRRDLEGIRFEFNPYNPCVANRTIHKRQHTVRFHVDDVLSSHVDPKVNTKFGAWANETYGKLKPVELHRGKVHEFLGMTLDYSKKGECHLLQDHHINDVVSSWPEDLSKIKHVLTPASNDLLKGGTGKLLCRKEGKTFHSVTAKCLFVSWRSRPDIAPTVSYLSGRVREGVANKNDWVKCRRLVKYLDSTRDLHLILRYDGLSLSRWYVDASYA